MLAALVFAAAIACAAASAGAREIGLGAWIAIALNAAVAGVLVGWTIENVPIESFGVGGWLRNRFVRRACDRGADRGRGRDGPADCAAGVRDDHRSDGRIACAIRWR